MVASFLREGEHATETLDMWVSRQPLRTRRGPMAVIFPHGTGLDGPQKTVMACRVAPDPTGRQADGVMERKACGTMTVDLLALSDWLVEAGITPVAGNARACPGSPSTTSWQATSRSSWSMRPMPSGCRGARRTRARCGGWPHGCGLAWGRPASSPGRAARRRRDHRATAPPPKGQERSREVTRRHGVLERANIKLASVATAMMDLSGRALLRAGIEGRADPATRAEVGPRADAAWHQATTNARGAALGGRPARAIAPCAPGLTQRAHAAARTKET